MAIVSDPWFWTCDRKSDEESGKRRSRRRQRHSVILHIRIGSVLDRVNMKILSSVVGVLVGVSTVSAFTTTHSTPRTFGRSLSMASTIANEETYTVTPIKSLDGTVTLPGSKSLSNRCLLLAALSDGQTKVDKTEHIEDLPLAGAHLGCIQVPSFVRKLRGDPERAVNVVPA